MLNQTGLKRVSVYVSSQREGVVICIHQSAVVAALEERADAVVPEIHILSVSSLDSFHRILEISSRSLEEKMVMVLHKTIHEQA